MRRRTGFLRITAAMGGVAALAFTAAPAVAAPSGSPTRLPFSPTLRICDHSASSYVSARGFATGEAFVTSSGSDVTADVHMATATPNTAYNVRLVQLPRPSWSTCSAGDAGTAVGVINTDGAGNGTVTLQDHIQPGATQVWIAIERPDPYSQTPAEFYTSDFAATI
jgi:hypothetical protein